MIRRCPAPLTAMVAALALGFGLQPISDAGRPDGDGRLYLDDHHRPAGTDRSCSRYCLWRYWHGHQWISHGGSVEYK